uniref:Glutamyl-tRNA(Gln) amidotransferase subunit A, mitochondrial n=1 Tax=Plectus sambesii TaxID=2011161 RepID=A0A914V5U4_9BILA
MAKLIEEAIERAARFRKLNLLITETFDLAREQATSAAEKKQNVFPLVVKDCFTLKGVRTTCASKMLANYVPSYTATVVQRLIDAGGCVVGKSNQDEFCMGTSSSQSYFGPVKSPWTLATTEKSARLEDNWVIPGGSSGGSAVAVACGIARIALGSDTGGSTRNPAAFCGVVGLKPSYGLLSRHGLIPLTNSLDCPAIFARSVDDINFAIGLMVGRDAKDSTTVDAKRESVSMQTEKPLKGLVVGLPKEYRTADLSPECWDAWNKVAGILESSGCQLKHVSLPHTEYSIVCYHIIGECDVASNMARYDGVEYGFCSPEDRSTHERYAASRSEALNEVVRRRILAGNYFLLREHYDEYFGQALRVRRLIAEDFARLFRPEQFGISSTEKVDILLTPVASSTAPLRADFERDDDGYTRERSDDYFTQPANMAGVPAISVPVTTAANGLPVAVQLVGDWMQDGQMLAVAKHIESIVKFSLPQFR